jgi:hypothetical protein
VLSDKYSCLYDVFPIQLLKSYNQCDKNNEQSLPMPDLIDKQDEWEVQEIHDAQKFDGALYYLVKWTGWLSEYDSWEPAEHLAKAPKKIQEFE